MQEELAPYPQVAIVLSSTWCIRPGYAKTLQLLPKELRARFIGGTFHKRVHGADPWLLSSFRDTSRGQQILEDVTRRKPRQWLALDDDIEDWPPLSWIAWWRVMARQDFLIRRRSCRLETCFRNVMQR